MANTTIPLPLLKALPDGRYASCLNENDYVFLRISRPVHGYYQNCTKIQQMRGDSWHLVMVINPDQTVQHYGGRDFTPYLMLICQNWMRAAKEFATKLERCGRCGTALQDPESRSRGIGPECVKHWPAFVQWTDQDG